MHDERELKQYDRWGVARPEHHPHGSPDEIRENLKRPDITAWRLEGNRLIATTSLGEIVNHIDPEYIMKGVDKDGLPILEKVIVS